MTKCKISTARLFPVLLFAATFCCSVAASAQTLPVNTIPMQSLPQNSKIMMFGDSITEIPALYPRYIEAYLLMCSGRSDISCFTAGHSGETMAGVGSRLQDVQGYNPNVVMINEGMNDSDQNNVVYTPGLVSNFAGNVSYNLSILSGLGVPNAIIAGPGNVDSTPIADGTSSNQDYILQQFSASEVPVVSGTTGAYLADVFDDMQNSFNAAYAVLGSSFVYGEHQGGNGAIFMVDQMLKSLAVNGSVGTITVNMNGGATATGGHTVVSASNGVVVLNSTTYPFCYNFSEGYDSTTNIANNILLEEALPYAPFAQNFNQFILKVTNLSGTSASVNWGGQTMNFSSVQLAAGINLPQQFITTPFDATFNQVMAAIVNKQYFEDYVTKYTTDYNGSDTRANIDQNMINVDAQLEAGVKSLILPVQHTIIIVPNGSSGPAQPVITGTMMAYGTVGSPFSYQITTFAQAQSFSASNLPGGLTLSTNTGLISGTPSSSSTNVVNLTAVNGSGTSTTTLTISVVPPAPTMASLNPTPAASGTVGQYFSYQLSSVSTAPVNYFVTNWESAGHYAPASSLPAGLTYNTNTGLISGTPTVSGSFSLQAAVMNSNINESIISNNIGNGGSGLLQLTIYGTSGSTPPPPGGLTATPGNNQVALTWTASPYATSYNVYRGTSEGGESSTPIATLIGSPAYTDNTVNNEYTYYYTVAAVNNAGTSAQSSPDVNATPVPPGTPSVPTGLTATAGPAQVSLSWTATPGAATYNIYSSTNPGQEGTIQGTTPLQSGITGTNYVNTGLPIGPTRYYKISAVNTSGSSGLSAEASATPYAAGGGSTTYYQDEFGRTGELAGTTPDTANTGGAKWVSTYGNGQYATTNGVATITSTATGWSAAFLPVNGSSSATLDGTRNFVLSAMCTAGNSRNGIGLSTNMSSGGNENLWSTSLATLTCGNNLYAYSFNGGPQYYGGVGDGTATTLSLSYNASAGTLTYTVGSTVIATATGVTASQIASLQAVALGNDGCSGTSSPTPTFTNFTLSVSSTSGSGSAPAITSALAATGTQNSGFSYQITASNGPTSFNATGLPGGLSVSTTSGIISGTPTTAGTSSVTISAINGSGTGSATLTLTIKGAAPSITSALAATGTQNSAFSYTITASNSPTSYNATGLPGGLSVSATTGIISGTPTTAGTNSVTISAINGSGTGSATLTLTINAAGSGSTTVVSVQYQSNLLASGSYTAGYIPETIWNADQTAVSWYNVETTGTSNLKDSTNTATGISESKQDDGTDGPWVSSIGFSNTGDDILFSHGVMAYSGSSGFVLNLSGLNSSYTYDLILYTYSMPGSYGAAEVTGSTAGGATYYYTTSIDTQSSYVQATSTTSASYPVANYVEWKGLSAPSGTLSAALNSPNAFTTDGFQLVIHKGSSAPVITSALAATGTQNSGFSYQIAASNGPTSFNATGLPGGLSVSATTGIISGTPPTAGTSSVTISAINGSGTGSATLILTVNAAAPVITSALAATGTQNSGFSYTITASNSPTSFNATGLPTGLSVSTSSGQISGTPTTAGTSSVTISAINGSGTGSATLTLSVKAAAPAITSALAATGTQNSAFSYTITASNSPTSYNATGLPGGLSVSTSSGQISGTPTTAGTSSVTISAINGSGTGSATLTLSVKGAAPVITSALAATGTQNSAFSYTITASNSPTSYNATGLPGGLSVSTSSGQISGTPTTAGTNSVTISAINGSGTGSATLTLTINAAGSGSTTVVSVQYQSNLLASGSYTAGYIPETIWNADQTAVSWYNVETTGTSNLKDSTNTATGISESKQDDGTDGPWVSSIGFSNTGDDILFSHGVMAYSGSSGFILNLSGLNSSYTYDLILYTYSMPGSYGAAEVTGSTAGGATYYYTTSIDTQSSYVQATSTTSASYPVANYVEWKGLSAFSGTLSAALNSPNAFTTDGFQLVIHKGGGGSAPVITSALAATGTQNSGFSYQIAASNGPTSFNATGLPAGLSVSATTGIISGTPTTAGTSSVTISAINGSGTGSATLTLTVNAAAPVITSALAATGTQNNGFSYTITASNSPTSFNATGLPTGLSVSTSSGQISGTPTTAGTSSVTISAINGSGTGSATLTLTVNAAAPVITSALAATGTQNSGFSYQIAASNGPTSFNATGLPAGLSVNTNSGAISGSPTASGTSSVTISAINGGGTGSATLMLTVNAPGGNTTVVSVQYQSNLLASGFYTAGYIPETIWNADQTALSYYAVETTGIPNLIDSTNTATGISESKQDDGTDGPWVSSIGFSNTGDDILFSHGVMAYSGASGYVLNLSGLNPSYTYDLILYTYSMPGSYGAAELTASTAGGVTYYYTTSIDTQSSYVQATSTTSASYPVANYVEWKGLSATSGTLSAALNSPNAFTTDGFQLVIHKASPTAPPGAPTWLTASGGASSVTLNWAPASNAISYNIYRGTSSGGETAFVNGIVGSTYTDSSVSNGTNYFYEVVAVNGYGSSGYSSEANDFANSTGGTGDINLSGYTLAFDDEFNSLSLSATSPKGSATWYAYPPNGAAGWFGDSKWNVNAFSVSNGVLNDLCWWNSVAINGTNWQSGYMASVDTTQAGFSQQYGYFEIRCQMPNAGQGAWPAFWLDTCSGITGGTNEEIDVFEWYGVCNTPGSDYAYVSEASHNWNPDGSTNTALPNLYQPETVVPDGLYPWQGYHTYGCLISSTNITWYIDGVETNQIATPTSYMTTPFYLMLNYALGGNWSLTGAPFPSEGSSTFLVDWVRVYSLP